MNRPPMQAPASAFAGGESVPRWDRAACRTVDARLFFPEDEDGEPDEDSPRAQAARTVCGRCPLREQCLSYALTLAMPFGIWGGLSTREREGVREFPGPRGAA